MVPGPTRIKKSQYGFKACPFNLLVGLACFQVPSQCGFEFNIIILTLVDNGFKVILPRIPLAGKEAHSITRTMGK